MCTVPRIKCEKNADQQKTHVRDCMAKSKLLNLKFKQNENVKRNEGKFFFFRKQSS